MQRVARNNLTFIDSSSSKLLTDAAKRFSHGALYQQTLLKLLASFETNQAVSSVTDGLVSLAEVAYAARQYELLGVVAKSLLNMPSRKGESSGLYYYALHLNRYGFGDVEKANRLFERVACEGSLPFTARAMLGLGRNSTLASDPKTALLCYGESARMLGREPTLDPVTWFGTIQNIAVIRSFEGDRRGALADLESLLPLANTVSRKRPAFYHDYLNSLAVEWGEAGRLAEARHVSLITNALPYASAYPEWRETLHEIESKTLLPSRSVVPVSQIPLEERDSPTQIVSWLGGPVREADSAPRRSTSSARIINLHDWKKKLDKKSNGNTQKKPSLEQIRAMTFEEKQATITRCVYADEVTEEMLDSILQVTLGSETGERDKV